MNRFRKAFLALVALGATATIGLAETRHLRSDTHNVNGLTAYQLGTSQSASVLSTQLQISADGSLQVWWGIRVWRRSAAGIETELTGGTPEAQVTRTVDGSGIQSTTWTPPITTFSAGDELVIRVYTQVGTSGWSQGGTAPDFISGSLTSGDLDGTWTVFYHTQRESNNSGKPDLRFTRGTFRWGDAAQDSRAENITILLTPAPGSPALSTIYRSSITATWTSVASQQGYILEASTASDFTGTLHSSITTNGSATSLTVDNPALTSNTTYYLRIGSRWNSGTTNYASTLSAVTLADPVSNISIKTVFQSSVTVTWDELVNANGYILEGSSTNFDGTGTVASSQTAGVSLSTLTLTSLDPNVTYYFRVASLNWIGLTHYATGPSTSTLALVPGAGSPNITDVFVSSISIQWTDGGNPAGTIYAAEISDDNFSSLTASGTTTGTTFLFNTGLISNTTYYLRVKALNHNSVSSAYRSLGSTATLTASPQTTSPAFLSIGTSSITVQWQDPTNPAGTDYVAEISDDNFFSILSSSNTTALSAGFNGLNANTTHWFRVKAVNHNNVPSAYTTLGSTSTLALTPSSPGFDSVGTSSITVTWTVPTFGAEGYRVQASSTNFNGSGTVHSTETTNGSDTGLTIDTPGLNPNTTYFFRLGSTNWNDVLNETSIGSRSALANGPVSPSIDVVNITSVTVSWSEPVGSAEGYRLEASVNPDFSGLVLFSSNTSGAGTTLAVNGLNSGTTYYFRVGSLNWAGDLNFTGAGSAQTLVSEDFIAPAVILDLTVSTLTATGARLDWTTPVPFDPTDDPLNGNYAIQYSTDAGVQWSTSAAQVVFSTTGVNSGQSQRRDVSGLLPNTTYHFRIWTSDLAPNWSDPSAISSNMTLSNPVTTGALTDRSSTTLSFAWTAHPVSPSSSSANGYRIEASSTNFNGTGSILSTQTLNGSDNSLVVENLEPNTTYYTRLASLNHKLAPNKTALNPVSTLAQDVTRLGSDFAAVTTTSATVQWVAVPSEGYVLEASSTNFNGTGVVRSSETSNPSLSTLTVSDLISNTTYYFRVGSLNWINLPNYTTLSATSTLADLPTGVSISSLQTNAATLSWIPPAGGSGGFRIEAALAPEFSSIAGSSETSNASATSLTVNGLSANTTYYFRAGSLNWNGTPNYAAAIATATLANAPQRILPDFLSVQSSSVTARWQALPAAPADQTAEGYRLEASTDAGFNGTIYFSSTTNVTESTRTLLNLAPSTTYYFRAGSLNWNGNPNYAVLDSTVTLPVIPVSAASTFTAVNITSVTVQWLSNGNGAGTIYELEASTAANFSGSLETASTENLSAALTSLSPNTTYYARVRAVNGSNQLSGYLTLGSTVTRTSLPGPGSPVFTPVNASSLTVTITAGSPANPDGTVYDIQLSSTASFSNPVSSVTTDLSATVLSLLPNTTYFARARSQNAAGAWSAYTDLGSTATLAVLPGAAASTFTALSNSGFTLNWSSGSATSGFNSSGTSYRAQISESPSFASITDEKQTSNLSAAFSGLLSGTAYYARVLAINYQGVETSYVSYGSTTTLPSSVPIFKTGTFEITNSLGSFIDPALYTDTTTVNVRVTVQSAQSPGLAVTDTPSMFAIWHMDENTGTTVGDASRHNRSLTLQGSPAPSWQLGHTGSDLQFDGSQNYAITGGLGPWRTSAANNVWTLEFWFKTGGAQGYLIQTANTTGASGTHDGEITWLNSSGNLVFSMKSDSGSPNATYDAEASQSFTDNQWHYVAALVDSGGIQLYVDGQLRASNTSANVTSTNARTYTSGSNFVWVGAGTKVENDYGSASRFFGGQIDSVRLSTTALTVQQIARNYNLGLAGHRWGSPDLDVSIQNGDNFSWTRISTAAVSVTGTNGTVAEQTFTVTGVPLIQTDSPGANTNRVTFLASDLTGGVATGQYTILVDTTPPVNVGLTSLTNPATGGWTVNAQAASDSPSGLASLPYLFEASTDSFFSVINASSNYISAATFRFETLDPNTTYYFRLRVKDAAGNESAYASSLSSSTLSNPVSDISMTQVYESSATLSWTTLPPNPSTSTSEGYVLEASTTNFNGTGTIYSSTTADSSLGVLTVDSLDPNTTYYFRVGSLNWHGVPNYQTGGSASTLAGEPGSPSFGAVYATSGTVTWSAPVGGSEGYRLDASTHSDFSSAVISSQTTDGGLTQLTIENLPSNTTTYFRVGSINWNNVVNYAPALSTSTLAGPPTGVGFDSVFISSAVVSWTAPSGGAAGFEVQASTTSNFTGTIESSGTSDPGLTSLTVLNLDPNATYFFRVGSLNWQDRLVFSSSLSTSTLANEPGSVEFSAVYFSSAALTWAVPAGGATGYRLDASTHSDFSSAVVSSQTANDNATTLTVSPLVSNATTYFRVGAVNWHGRFTFSSTLSTSTLAGAPQTVSITNVFVSSAALSWTPPSGGSAGYRVEASTASDFTGTIESSVTTNGSATSLAVLNLQPNTTYYFRAGSLNWGGTPVYASSLSTSTLANPPDSPAIAAIYFSSVTLSWTTPAGGANGYRIDASTASTFAGSIESSSTLNGLSTSLTVLNLDSNTTYFFRIGSINQGGVISFTAALATATRAGPPENVAFVDILESSATLTWTIPGGGSAGYQLDASTASDFTGTIESSSTSNGTLTSLTVPNLNPNTTTYFRVGSRNWSDDVVYAGALSTSTLANPPDSPAIADVYLSSAVLQWNAPASGAEGFRAEASTASNFTGTIESSATLSGTETQIAIPNLDSNTTYYFRIGSLNWNNVPRYDSAGSTSTLAQPVARIAPDFLAVYPASVTVRWQARPSSPMKETSEGYRLEASSTNFNGTGDISVVETADIAQSTLTATALNPNTTTYFRVGSLNWNDVPTYTILPATSTLANTVVSPIYTQVNISSVTVSWSLSAGGAEGYIVEASTASDFSGFIESSETTNGGLTSLTVQSLVSNTTYYFRVGALNWDNTANYISLGSTRTLSSIDPTGPDAVDDLSAAAVSHSSIRLDWSAPADATDNPLSGAFLIQHSTWAGVSWTTGSAQITISTSGVNPDDPQTHLINSLDSTTTYYFRIWTQDTRPNTSPLSNGATVATLANAPTGLTFDSVDETSSTLSWSTAPSFGYLLQASTDSTFQTAVHSTQTDNGSLPSLSIPGLDRNTTYFYRVGSLNHVDAPNFTSSLSTSTLSRKPNRLASDFVSIYQTSATIHWAALPSSPQSESSEGYRLEASSTNFSGSGSILVSSTTDSSVSTRTVFNLDGNTTIYFRVGSLNWNAVPNYTLLDSTATLAFIPAPAPPPFSLVGVTSVTLQWADGGNPAGTSYQVQIATTSNFTGSIHMIDTTDTSATKNSLDPNTTHYARVKAVNHNGISTAYLSLNSTMTRTSAPGAASPSFDPVYQTSFTVSYTSGTPANPAGTTYTVEISTESNFASITSSRTTALSAGFSSLLINTTYYARVRSENGLGVFSGFTNLGSTATLSVPPGAAASTFTNVGNRSFTLNWSSGTSATGHNPTGTVYLSEVSTASDFTGSLSQNQTTNLSTTFSGLDFGTIYYARVRSVSHQGVESAVIDYGNVATTPSSEPLFINGTFQVTNSSGTYIDGGLYTDTTTVNVRVDVQSSFAPGLAVTDTPGHLAIWHFDEGTGSTVQDSSLHGHGLTLNGSPLPVWTAAPLGSSLDFDGSQNYAVSADLQTWRRTAGDNSWTVELWFKTGSNTGYLLQTSNKNSGSPTNFDLDIGWHNTSGNLAFALRTNTGQQRIAEAGSSYADNGWHHVAAVLDSTGMLLYVDGSEVGSNTDINNSSARTYSSTIYAWIGRAHLLDSNIGNGSAYTTALIDEIRISTIGFSAGQVSQSYQLNRVHGHLSGGPSIDISTSSGNDFTWVRTSTDNATLTGSNGSTSVETYTGSTIDVVQTTSAGADTNRVMFLATDLDGTATTAQYTILVDTTPPTAGPPALLSVAPEEILVQPSASDNVSGLHDSPYWVDISTESDFSVITASTGWTDQTQPLFTNLQPETTYYLRGRARDAVGNVSGFSSSVSTQTPPVILSVSLSTDTFVFGALSPGATVLASSSITVTNDGNVTEAFGLRIVNPTIWTSTSFAPGVDTFRLTGLFKNSQPDLSDFDLTEDVILTSTATPTASAFAVTGDPLNEKGFNVAPNESRTLWIRIEAPNITSTDGNQIIRLKAVAIKE